MPGETGGNPRAWLAVDETAAAFLSRSLSTRSPIILPPPLHRAPLRPGNVVEIAGPSNSGKSHLLLMAAVQCILPKEWEGIYFGGLGKAVMYLDLDCRFDVLRLAQILRNRIAEGRSSAHQRNGELEKDAALEIVQSQFRSEVLGVGIYFLMIDSIGAFYWIDRGSQPVRENKGGSSKCMLEDSTVLRYSRQEEERNLSCREYMPSIWQLFVTHRIKLQVEAAEFSSVQENDFLSMDTSEWLQPSLKTKEKFSIGDDGIVLVQ